MANTVRFFFIAAMVFMYSAVVSADWDDEWDLDSRMTLGSWGGWGGWGGWRNNFYQPRAQARPQPVQRQWRPNPFLSGWFMDDFMDW